MTAVARTEVMLYEVRLHTACWLFVCKMWRERRNKECDDDTASAALWLLLLLVSHHIIRVHPQKILSHCCIGLDLDLTVG